MFTHLKSLVLEPIIIGGIKKGRHWMWEKVERYSSQSYRRKRSPRRNRRKGRSGSSSSYESTVQVSIQYFKWFPGNFYYFLKSNRLNARSLLYISESMTFVFFVIKLPVKWNCWSTTTDKWRWGFVEKYSFLISPESC